MTTAPEAAPGIRVIDTEMGGRPELTSAYLVEGDRPALVETAGSRSLDAVARRLSKLGIGPDDIAHVVVTHVHLDHAGGAGTFARHFPRATVWAHPAGAPHLADPTKLVRSATRVFGAEHIDAVFGPMEPVPPDRLRAAEDGAHIDVGGRTLAVIHAPGHAKHHLFLADSDTGAIWTGDGLGILLPAAKILRPGTPPPDFDLAAAVRSVELVADRDPSVLLLSHFGPARHVQHLCQLAIRRMRKWAAIVERAMRDTRDPGQVARRLEEATAAELNAAGPEGRVAIERSYDMLTTHEMNALGLMRYLEQEQRPEPPSGPEPRDTE